MTTWKVLRDSYRPASIRHSSETTEHFTPSAIVEAARRTLGTIDLDPASCAEANECIRATRFYSQEDNGFRKAWKGRVFLNPPGGLSDNQERQVKPKCRVTGSCGLPPGHTHEGVEAGQKKWWFKLAEEFKAGRVREAIFVCFSVELLQNAQVKTPEGLLTPLDFPICFPSRRVAYGRPGGLTGSQPPHASAIIYLGGGEEVFREMFSPIGKVIPNE